MSEGQLASADDLRGLLESTLPCDEVEYAIGYGSGVLLQQLQSNSAERGIIDLIVAVKDSYRFHEQNYALNAHHYRSYWLTHDPPASITWWQRHEFDTRWLRNPKVYFNVTDGLKYGVVQSDDLCDDLGDWRYLYLAGRMHKPTVEVLNRHERLAQLQARSNLPAALSAALLLQAATSSVSAIDIYTSIAAMSYTGDFRTTMGAEDPLKVQKLVQSPGQLERFETLYRPAAERLEADGVLTRNGEEWSWDTSASGRLWSDLPDSVRRRVPLETSDLAAALASDLVSIVAPSARYQSIKGLATAGWSRSVAYAARKLSKGLLRKR